MGLAVSRLFILIYFGISSSVALAQSASSRQELEFGTWYDSLMGWQRTELTYGPIYLTAIRGNTTHQYFKARNWRKGSIIYNKQRYDQIDLLYDLQQQQLVVKHPDLSRTDGLALDMNLLDEFVLDEHQFKKYADGSSIHFHDIIYEGPFFTFTAKRRKLETAQKGGVELREVSEYYLIQDGFLYAIKGTASIQKRYPELKKSIQQLRLQGYRVNLRNEESTLTFLKKVEELIVRSQ